MRTLRTILLVAALLPVASLHAQTPTKAQVDKILDKAKADLDALYVTPPVTTVTSNLQAAIDKAAVGATLVVGPVKETSQITISRALTLVAADPVNRPQLNDGLVITASHVSVTNVDVRRLQDQSDVLIVSGDSNTLTDVRVFGRIDGQHRGILANGSTHLTLRRVRSEGIWLPDQDAQAFACWDGCSDVLIEDPYFSGAGETLLIGGDNEASQAGQPKNITIRGTSPSACVLTKDLAWKKPGVQVKTTLEMKNVVGFLVENCRIDNAWQSAQDGYLITLTPRNQYGRAPWTEVSNGIIRNNTGGNAAGFVNAAGTDTDGHVSGTLHDVQILNNTMSGFDPSVWKSGASWGTNKLIQIIKGPANLTISGNVLSGAHYDQTPSGNSVEGSGLYFDESPPMLVNFTFTRNTFPITTYPIMGGNSSPGLAWEQYVASGLLQGNTER